MKVSVRDEAAVLQVIDLCSVLEDKALGIYESLLDLAENERMRDLWATLVEDEKEHRNYWLRLKDVCAAGGVPEVFDEPRRYIDELQALMSRLDHLGEKVRSEPHAPAVFIHALNLEFLLLHPSFVTLFHYLPESSNMRSPSRTYDQHLGKLLNVLMDYDELPPELELLGEAIGQVWKKSEEGAANAVTDNLTGVLNRRGLYNAMKPLAYLARRERETAGILIMEVSNLKEINDAHGYRVGDEMLAEAAKVICSRLRGSDVVGRFGGDDFLGFLTRFDLGKFERIGAEIGDRVRQITLAETGVAFTVGGAFSIMEEDVEGRLEELIRAADASLNRARKEGKDCLVRKL